MKAESLHPMGYLVLLCAHATAALSAPGLAAKGVLAALPILVGGRRLAGRKAFRAAVTFGGFVLLLTALTVPGRELGRWGPLTVTFEGLRMGGEMAFRFLSVLTGSLLFVAVVRPDRFAAALSQTPLPYRYTYLLVLALRFLPLFREEYWRVREAQTLRGLALRPWNLPSHVRWTVFPVLASALGRADGVALAMQARGFGTTRRRTTLDPIRWRWADAWVLATAAGLWAAAGWFLAGGGAAWP